MDDPLDSTRGTRKYRLSLAHCHLSPFIRRTTRDILIGCICLHVVERGFPKAETSTSSASATNAASSA